MFMSLSEALRGTPTDQPTNTDVGNGVVWGFSDEDQEKELDGFIERVNSFMTGKEDHQSDTSTDDPITRMAGVPSGITKESFIILGMLEDIGNCESDSEAVKRMIEVARRVEAMLESSFEPMSVGLQTHLPEFIESVNGYLEAMSVDKQTLAKEEIADICDLLYERVTNIYIALMTPLTRMSKKYGDRENAIFERYTDDYIAKQKGLSEG